MMYAPEISGEVYKLLLKELPTGITGHQQNLRDEKGVFAYFKDAKGDVLLSALVKGDVKNGVPVTARGVEVVDQLVPEGLRPFFRSDALSLLRLDT